MKNLKRTLAVVIALTMVMSTVAFAAVFSDVEDTASYAEAVELGVAINLFTGYEDGSFKPAGDITRAEFSAVIVRMLGQEAQASGAAGSTKFTDVPSTHWAAGYVNICTNTGIINGYGDGRFGPEDNVTYEQAVKMVVVALGYEPAVGSAGYPVGYLTIAQQRGITTGVKGTNGVAINRGQVAQLALNALDVPIMEQTGFGTYVDYIVQDGYGDSSARKTLLSENLGILRVKVMVEESYELTSSSKEDLVKVRVERAYRSVYGQSGEDFEEGTTVDINIGKTNLKSLVGYPVILYVDYDEYSYGDPVAVYARKDLSSTGELTVFYDDVDTVTNESGYVDVAYWASETARTPETISVDTGVNSSNVYVNGHKVTSTTIKSVLESFYGTVTFALNNRSSSYDYDTVYISKYENGVVESVNMTTGRVNMKDGASAIIFNTTNNDFRSKLFDEDGNELDWSVLEENDVLSTRVAGGSGTRTVKMATLVRKAITGVVTEKSGTDDEPEYKIGGTEYKIDLNRIDKDEIKLQDEGTFYLDIFGRIVYFEAESGTSSNYAYILNSERTQGSFDPRLEIQMFTFDGEVVTLRTATRVSFVQGSTRTSYGSTNNPIVTPATIPASGYLGSLETLIAANHDKVMTFSVNASGDISRVSLAVDTTSNENYLTRYAGPGNADYRGSSQTIRVSGSSAIVISDKTVIMLAPPATSPLQESKYEILSLSSLGTDDDDWTNVSVFDVDRNQVAGLILVGNPDSMSTAASTGIALVSRVSTVQDSSGDTLDRLTMFQNGESRQVNVDSALEGDISAYSAIIPRINASGLVTSYQEIAKISGNSLVRGADLVNTSNVDYVIGTVTAKRGNRITIGDDVYLIPSGANVYLYNHNANRVETRVTKPYDVNVFDVYEDGSTLKYTDEYGYNLTKPVRMLIRQYEGRIADVVVYFGVDYTAPAAPVAPETFTVTFKVNAVDNDEGDDDIIVETIEVDEGDTLETSDFPDVPARPGYNGVWSETEDLEDIDADIVVTALYTEVTPDP